jgi:DNA-binding LacI/PurR family transcriptional regulator
MVCGDPVSTDPAADPASGVAGCRPATLRDVARLAGVSAQTVSRVVNNQELVARDTRSAVLRAVSDLGYRPNRAARALVTQHSRLIGLVIAQDDRHHDAAAAIRAVDLAAQHRGYAVLIRHISLDAPALTQGQVHQLLDQGVEGIIALFPDDRIRQALTRNRPRPPVAFVESPDTRPDIPCAPTGPLSGYDVVAQSAVDQIVLPLLTTR